MQYGLIGLAGLTVVGLLALWGTGQGRLPVPGTPGPTFAEQRQIELQTALAEARQRLDERRSPGDARSARPGAAGRPENEAARALRAEVERVSLDLSSAAEREQRVSEGLILAREEYAKRRYESAIAAANGVLELVPDHPEAVKLAADSEAALRVRRSASGPRERREKPRQRRWKCRRPGPRPSATGRAGPCWLPSLRTRPSTSTSTPRRPEGSLTVYAGERQIFREPFKFVKKTGFLSKEKIPGALGAQRTLPAGAVSLRVYVTLPGKPTKAIVVEGRLAGGSKRRLIVRVDGDGQTLARLE